MTSIKIVTCPVEAFYFEKMSGGFGQLCYSRCIRDAYLLGYYRSRDIERNGNVLNLDVLRRARVLKKVVLCFKLIRRYPDS